MRKYIYIYIYICVCVCMCVCVFLYVLFSLLNSPEALWVHVIQFYSYEKHEKKSLLSISDILTDNISSHMSKWTSRGVRIWPNHSSSLFNYSEIEIKSCYLHIQPWLVTHISLENLSNTKCISKTVFIDWTIFKRFLIMNFFFNPRLFLSN